MNERGSTEEKGEDDHPEKEQPLDPMSQLSYFLVQSWVFRIQRSVTVAI